MSKKYLDIKKRLKFEVVKETGNDLAYLTHYFQNHKNGVSQYFKPSAEKYLYNLHEKLKLVEEPDFQYYLPIQWDIPFPPVKNPKFKFIDLFAGIGGIRLEGSGYNINFTNYIAVFMCSPACFANKT